MAAALPCTQGHWPWGCGHLGDGCLPPGWEAGGFCKIQAPRGPCRTPGLPAGSGWSTSMVVLSPAAASPAASAPPRHLRGGFPSCPNLGVTPRGRGAWVQPGGFLHTVTRTALLTPSSHSHWLHKSLGQVLEVSTRQHSLGPWLPAAVPSRALCWGHLPLQSPREPRRSTPSNAHPPCIRAGKKLTPRPCDTVLSHKGSRPAPAVATTVRWQCGQAPAKRTVPWSCQDMASWWGQQAGRVMQCLPGWL